MGLECFEGFEVLLFLLLQLQNQLFVDVELL